MLLRSIHRHHHYLRSRLLSITPLASALPSRSFQSKLLEEMSELEKKMRIERERRKRERMGSDKKNDGEGEDLVMDESGTRGWGHSLMDHARMMPQEDGETGGGEEEYGAAGGPGREHEEVNLSEKDQAEGEEERKQKVFDFSDATTAGDKLYENGINVTQYKRLEEETSQFLDRMLGDRRNNIAVDSYVRQLVEKMVITARLLRFQDTSEGISACMVVLEDNAKSMVMKDPKQLERDLKERGEELDEANDDEDGDSRFLESIVSEDVMLERFENVFRLLTLFIGEDAPPTMLLRALIMQVHFDRNDEIEQSYAAIMRMDMERTMDPNYIVYKAIANHQLATYIAKHYSDKEMRMMDALDLSITAHQLFPKSALILTTRAYLQRDFEKGLKDLDMAIELEPENSQRYLHRAQFLRTHGRFDEAFNDLDRAARTQPANIEIYIHKCLFNLEQQIAQNGPFDLTRVSRIFDKLLSVLPPRVILHLALESAETILENAKAMNYPQLDTLTHMFMGLSYLAAARVEEEHHQGDRTEQIAMAAQNFAQVVDLDPNFEEAQRHLAQSKWMLGDHSS